MTGLSIKVMEHLTRVTPFGARFWDDATRQYIPEGIRLRAWRGGDTRRRAVEGTANRSGVFFLAGLPGMHDVEYGAGDDAFWTDATLAASPPRHPFRIEMTDLQGRFLPYGFEANLPVQGLFAAPARPSTSPAISPPGEPLSRMPLFSSATRPAPAALAVVRSELREARTGLPAAWALLDVRWEGNLLGTGMADREGRATVFFAYPEPQPKHLRRSSPPPPPITAAWEVSIEAFYARRYAKREDVPAIESLENIFDQPPRALLSSTGSPALALAEQHLRLGSELIVRSGESPYLFIQTP